jgi:hypothetical protein
MANVSYSEPDGGYVVSNRLVPSFFKTAVFFNLMFSGLSKISYCLFCLNGMSSIGYLGRFFETARTAW